MIKAKTIFAAIALCGALASPTFAAEGSTVAVKTIPWTFGGVFGTFDKDQLQRGFQVFREVCSSCHSANLLSFRNLGEPGGPEFTAGQVKQLASEYKIADPTAAGGERPAIPADHWPAPFATEQDARDSNNGAMPPDFSVLAKARGIERPFPTWVFDYFTAYQEGGADYVYNLLTNFTDPPQGVTLAAGQNYNAFLGIGISMPKPLQDGTVTYADGFPETVEQYAQDVAAFMMWVSEPHMVARKELGFKVLIVLALFAGLMFLVKRKLWSNVPH